MDTPHMVAESHFKNIDTSIVNISTDDLLQEIRAEFGEKPVAEGEDEAVAVDSEEKNASAIVDDQEQGNGTSRADPVC